MFLILLSLLGIFLQNVSANTSSCSMEDLRSCRADALEQMSGSSGSDSTHQEKQCRDLRNNFDCMLWQTSMCLKNEEQDSNSDVILKTWRYLQGFCEKYGNWWAVPCFQRDDVKRCETLLPSKKNTVDSSSCRLFLNFRDCVLAIADDSCSSSDKNLLATYFMEKGQQMSWRCSKGNNDYTSAASAQQVDRRYPPMYGDSSNPSSNDPCFYSARSELDTCRERFDSTQSDAMRRDDSDMRNHRMCCGLVHFEQCVRDALYRKCSRDIRRMTEEFVYPVRSRLSNACRDHTTYSCNSANNFIPPNAMAASLAACLLSFIYMKSFF